ncbi:ABC transporter ATP-binding protein [Rhodococcus sp. AG1013]|uniref:ABC transporter ATP-binding protein n=1 Tax=unclassified Rhodococcus (in: high G+C Gram-positive bacteria) TaxID=192944 RepID=UPI000E0C8E59|nr:ABC transporter ATP-binding protein [Rhodococcus sp. AG1013]RDI15689.1 putative ABC transport system ATP-binding protein [Rhodococcus sp. AG1013]
MSSFTATPPLIESPPRAAVRLDAVTKSYGSGRAEVTALDNVSLTLAPGSFTAVMGPSGSGKSTFLHCAAGLDQPTRGSVWLGDTELSSLKPKARTVFRRDHIGFVFQAYNLMSALTVEQNVTLPLLLAGRVADRAHLDYVLNAVGLDGKRDRRPAEMSGGQQQRVAIARALITQPHAVFADEPTGALDSRTGRQVLDLLRRTTTELGQTIVMVTHDPVAAAHADRVLFLADGRLVGRMESPTAAAVADHMTHLGEW